MIGPQADLSGRTAIVTGGSRGIGMEIARCLTGAGANVVLTSRKWDLAEEAADRIGKQAVGFGAHSLDRDAAAACVDFAIERFGGLDVLVNNAGTNAAFGPLVDVGASGFAKTFELNTWAPVLWTGLAWHRWMGEHGGAVVNVASIGGLEVAQGLGAYNASKAALIHLTRHAAVELAPAVRVNAVAPGLVRTRLAEALWSDREAEVAASMPLERIAEPADVAPVVAFLASDGARWVTGETVVVDGGELAAGSTPRLQLASDSM